MDINAEMITQFPLFASLDPCALSDLLETAQLSVFRAGEVLFEEGSLTEYFYGVLEGEVEVVKSLGTSDERVVAVSKKGSILGEMSMFSKNGSHTASARAFTPLKMLIITFDQFNALLQSCPAMTHDLLRLYSSRLEDSERLTIQDLHEKNRQLTLAYQELKTAQAAMIENEKLEHELQLAGEIQRGILPEYLPEVPGLDFGALMIPAHLVGGDFYDFIVLDDSHIGIMVGDVCDKGMPAALLMALTYSSMRIEVFRHDSPGDTLRAVNHHLVEINRSNLFVTLLYGVLDCQTREFTYARAGHPEPLVMDGHNQPLKVPRGLGQPLSVLDNPILDEQRITIPPGGTVLLYSDGLSETIEATPDSPELSQLCSQILEGNKLNAQALCDHIWRTVGGFAAVSLIEDDFTIVALRNLS